MSWPQFEAIILGSIPGVLALGAAGSLLAMLAVWLVRKAGAWYIHNYAPEHAVRAFYPYIRVIRETIDLKDYLQKEGRDNHQLFLIESLVKMTLEYTVFKLLLFTTIFAFIIIWPEHPYALSFLVCITISGFHSALKAGISYHIMRPEKLTEKQLYIAEKYKNFKQFKLLIKSEISENSGPKNNETEIVKN